jgi:glutathione synthase/RimK-type ligase-like ATP-grasp enzyme
MSVLILADDEDQTARRVAAELAGRGAAVDVFDMADFPLKLTLSAEIGTGRAWAGRIGGACRLDLAGISAVYYRKPTQFKMPEGMSGPERVFAYGEARRGFGGVLQALAGCLWVNDPVAAARCEYKPVQLAAAAAVGLAVPPTLITNEPAQAHAWAQELGRPVIYKPLSGIWHADEGQVRALYTAVVEDTDDLLDPAFSGTANLLQARIRAAREARAVVVGEKVLTVAIDSTVLGEVDWRATYGHHHYEQIELPALVNAQLVELHQRLGLVYGAADLILDADTDRWTLLETNCSGAWGWLAEETGITVAEALADQLLTGRQAAA